MVVVGTTSQARTFLAAVQKVLLETGNPDPGTLTGAPRHVMRAMEAVRDALEEVWYAAEWTWRINHFRIELVENKMWYPLPDDFGSILGPISIFGEDELCKPYAYEKLLEEYPQLRAFPEESAVADTTTDTQLLTLTDYFGTPTRFVIAGEEMGLFKIPDADCVADVISVAPAYYRGSPDLVGDTDQLMIGRAIYRAHHKIALGLFKQYAEMSDWKEDLIIGRDWLDTEVMRHRRRSGASTEFKRASRDR